MAYIFGSIWDRFNRNALNDLSKSVEYQGKSIQDLVAKGQLTPTQYATLIQTVNGLVSKGSITDQDLDKNSFNLDGSFFSSEFISELKNGVINTTNVLDNSLTTEKYIDKSVTGVKISEEAIKEKNISRELKENFDGVRAVFEVGSNALRLLRANLDISNISIANKKIGVSFDYFIPDNGTTTIESFLWAEKSGQTRLSETTPILQVESDDINNVYYEANFPEERDTLSLFVRVRVPSLVESELSLKNVSITIGGVKYNIENFGFSSTVGSIKKIRNLPIKLITQSDIDELDFSGSVIKPLPLKGKRWMTFGDSVTWYDKNTFAATHVDAGGTAKGYQSYIEEEFGVTIINRGGSGYRLADNILGLIKSNNYSDIDYVSITSGANDFRANKIIGEIAPIGSTFDETTFYGALQSGVEHILSQNPYIKIYLLTPAPGWADGKGKMPKEYAQTFIDVAKLYGLPVCDWYHGSTINDITKDVFMGDGDSTGYDLHPTNSGFKRMGELLVGTIKINEL